jgi:diguanylate cyclase (GGDEF)-like protein
VTLTGLNFFDGVAVASSCIAFFLAWAFSRLRLLGHSRGTGLLSLAMSLGGFAWFTSAVYGHFVYRGFMVPFLVVVVPALLAVSCLIVGLLNFIVHGSTPWKRLLSAVILQIVMANLIWVAGGPRWATDLILSIVIGSGGVYCLMRHRKTPDAGYLPIAIALFSYPLTCIAILVLGVGVENQRQLLGVPFALIGVMILFVGFFRTHGVMSVQLHQIQSADQKLRALVYHDEVTGLRSPNAQRVRMEELLERKAAFSLMTINLDDFQLVNDNLGPVGGNAVIAEVGHAMRDVVGDSGELARGTGAEFTVLVESRNEATSLMEIANGIFERLASPLHYEALNVYVSLSIGVAKYPVDSTRIDELFRMSDVALHEAQRVGGNCVCEFDSWMDLVLQTHVWLDHNIRAALDLGQFELHYQPKLLMTNGLAEGVEALLRWKHPTRGNISPDQFIGRAEVNGMIIPLGRWVIDTAAKHAAAWVAHGRRVRVAINVSAKQLSDKGLLAFLETAQITAHGLLDIELTESCLAYNENESMKFIAKCREMGFGVHLDDFGTGYSSLSRLHSLPLTMIKLDRSFISPIGKDDKAHALLRAMVSIGKELDLQMVAEGVETQEQADYLRALGVTYAQGWLYARAMAPEQLDAWFHENLLTSTKKIGGWSVVN